METRKLNQQQKIKSACSSAVAIFRFVFIITSVIGSWRTFDFHLRQIIGDLISLSIAVFLAF